MPRFVLAPDSLKGSLSAAQACAAMERGLSNALGDANCQCVSIPLADGGEGTVEAVLRSTGGKAQAATVHGPLGDSVMASWGLLPDGGAILEMAQASGLTLVPPLQRRAGAASSYGTGQLVRAALDAGCRDILLGIGGSATTDGGAGALQALGARWIDRNGNDLPPGGAALARLHAIDLQHLDARLRDVRLTVLCDVTNPLYGLSGAARVYGPQKGATPDEVELLDAALAHFADVARDATGHDLREEPGAGAAGGIGWGLMTFCGATLRPGIAAILDAMRFAEKLETADWVLTAEGSIDAQTLSGKTIAGITNAARHAKGGVGVPVIAFGGMVKLSGVQLDQLGLVSAFPIADSPLSLDECIHHADELLATAVERATRLLRLTMRNG